VSPAQWMIRILHQMDYCSRRLAMRQAMRGLATRHQRRKGYVTEVWI
jgi:hypothetical protein